MWFLVSVLVLILLGFLIWKKRWILYHSVKVPGPLAIPLVGTLAFVKVLNCADLHKFLNNVLESYPSPVLKIWSGPQLYICTSRPDDVETVLTTNLDKPNFYSYMNYFTKESLLTTRTALWKVNRKLINPSFNQQLLNSFHGLFVKYANQVRTSLDKENEIDVSQMAIDIWKANLDSSIEILGKVDPTLIENRHENIYAIMKFESLVTQLFYKFWLSVEFMFKSSSVYRDILKSSAVGRVLANNVILEHKKLYSSRNKDEPMQKKCFLSNLIEINNETGRISGEQIYEETIFMLLSSSESTALTANIVFLFLGIHLDIQEKVYEEIISVMGANGKDPSLEDINRLDYLERVIKETMRLGPIIPYIMRNVTEDIKADPYIYPAGSNVLIPIVRLHKDPKVWPNPNEFDPDRFLPEEVAKRHRCSYIPFSFGTRNCIGLKYAMMSVKTTVAVVLKNSRVRAVSHKSIDEIEWDFLTVLKPKNCKVIFEKRD